MSRRLARYPGVVAVAEPTSMTWLPLALSLSSGGGRLALVGTRHSARLRGAISGKNKSDVIDADVLARADEVFDLPPLVLAAERICSTRSGTSATERVCSATTVVSDARRAQAS